MSLISNEFIQSKLDAAMPWIARYIAAASAVCTLAMTADMINGFRQRKLWFPSKYFCLGATSLTLLTVAMKLPVDLNTILLIEPDWYAKISGLVFMSTAMGNFTSSLGSMTNKELLSNIIALGILVITVAVNVCIQVIQLRYQMAPNNYMGASITTFLMLAMFATIVASAIVVPTTKRCMESKYQEMHKLALKEEESSQYTLQKHRMMKYWVMAVSSSPQFVMARSVVCANSSLICLVVAITLTIFYTRISLRDLLPASGYGPLEQSVYREFNTWILGVQSIGVVLGTIAPTLRLYISISLRHSNTSHKSIKSIVKEELFTIEAYWIQMLVHWRDSFSSLQIKQGKCSRYIHNTKWLVLSFFIGVQISIVVVSKLSLYVFVLLTTPFSHIKNKFKMQSSSNVVTPSDNNVGSGDTAQNLSRYVLLLEGEPELPKWFLNNICRQADNMILTGQKKKPQNLINLLRKFENFNGVREFDSTNEVPSLHSQEPPNCWTLPLVTLTSIATTLPNVAKHKGMWLMSSVNEGLPLAKLIDKILNTNAELINIRKSADISWVGVVLYRKWQGVDLQTMSQGFTNSKDMLKELSKRAERIVVEFKREAKDFLMDNPINWPSEVISANSMYRVSRTILLAYKGEKEPTDDELFERMSVMIADILAACLTNLARVITTMCHHNAIEKREQSVHKAFILLGKTEQVLQLLQQREWPDFDADKAIYIEEWRSLFQQGIL